MLNKRLNRGVGNNKLSFMDEDEPDNDEDAEPKPKRRCFGKNPNVNTLFLDDKERVVDEVNLKKKLIEDFLKD